MTHRIQCFCFNSMLIMINFHPNAKNNITILAISSPFVQNYPPHSSKLLARLIIHWNSCRYTVANDTFVIQPPPETTILHTIWQLKLSWWHCKIAMLESSGERTKIAGDTYIHFKIHRNNSITNTSQTASTFAATRNGAAFLLPIAETEETRPSPSSSCNTEH